MCFGLLVFAGSLCLSVLWLTGFWMLVSMPRFLASAAASLQPLTILQCFKTLGSKLFDGLMVCWVCVVWFVIYEKIVLKRVRAHWVLSAGFLAFGETDLRVLVPKCVIWHWLHFGFVGDPGTLLGHWGAEGRTL